MTVDDALAELEGNEQNVRFARLVHICTEMLGEPRISGSHYIFRTPWIGDPRINLQEVKGKGETISGATGGAMFKAS